MPYIQFVVVKYCGEQPLIDWPIMALLWICPLADLAQKSIQMCRGGGMDIKQHFFPDASR